MDERISAPRLTHRIFSIKPTVNRKKIDRQGGAGSQHFLAASSVPPAHYAAAHHATASAAAKTHDWNAAY